VSGGPAHAGSGPPAVLVAALVLAAAGYVMAAMRLTQRGHPWPRRRTAGWLLGLLAAGVALAVPADQGLGRHMVGHTLLGMVAPLLLVMATPVTLALRALPTTAARRLARVLRTPLLRVLSHPLVAAALAVGGLWLLYRSGLHEAAMHDPLLQLAVQTHVLLAGYLLTAVLVGRDPLPHRAGLGVRAAVLVTAVAAHDVLAKSIVADPPPGVGPAEALDGAQVMYYLGAPIEIALFVLLGVEWSARDRRARDRPGRERRGTGVPPVHRAAPRAADRLSRSARAAWPAWTAARTPPGSAAAARRAPRSPRPARRSAPGSPTG
jgi:putative membrane protein